MFITAHAPLTQSFSKKKNIKNITILINQQYRHWDNEMYIYISYVRLTLM